MTENFKLIIINVIDGYSDIILFYEIHRQLETKKIPLVSNNWINITVFSLHFQDLCRMGLSETFTLPRFVQSSTFPHQNDGFVRSLDVETAGRIERQCQVQLQISLQRNHD